MTICTSPMEIFPLVSKEQHGAHTGRTNCSVLVTEDAVKDAHSATSTQVEKYLISTLIFTNLSKYHNLTS
jgi:hypothetical protein